MTHFFTRRMTSWILHQHYLQQKCFNSTPKCKSKEWLLWKKKLLVGAEAACVSVSLASSESIRCCKIRKAELIVFRNGKKQHSKSTSILLHLTCYQKVKRHWVLGPWCSRASSVELIYECDVFLLQRENVGRPSLCEVICLSPFLSPIQT